MIAVLEVELAPDGLWQGELSDVRTSDDVEMVPSLDGFNARLAQVRIGARVLTLDVYQKGDLAFVRLDAL